MQSNVLKGSSKRKSSQMCVRVTACAGKSAVAAVQQQQLLGDKQQYIVDCNSIPFHIVNLTPDAFCGN